VRHSPFWATATLVRSGDATAVDNLFNRESVLRFNANEADKLIQSYLEVLSNCREDIHAGDAIRKVNYGVRLAGLLPEVISRLCCKCSMETKHRVLKFITELYASPDKAKYRNVRNLFKRLISSMSKKEQYLSVPALLKISCPDALNLIIEDEFLNPFLLLDLDQKPEFSLPALDIQPRLVENLFQQAAEENSEQRRWAISSLTELYKLQLFDAGQHKKLADVIWAKTDQNGLPGGTDFYKFAFLSLPHPEAVDPLQCFKKYVKATPFPIQKNNDVSMTVGGVPLVNEIIGANCIGGSIWTKDDAIEILQRLIEWWDADKGRLTEKESDFEPFTSVKKEIQSRFLSMSELLAEVIAPKLDADSPDEIKKILSRLIKEMREHGLSVLAAEAACLHIYPGQKADVYNRINEALVSNQDDFQKDGLSAVEKIILTGIDSKANSEEPNPVLALGQYITWMPVHSIIPALWIVVRTLKNTPASFPSNLEVVTLGRLDRLLSETDYNNGNQELTFDTKLATRRTSAILAATLWTHYKSRGASIPDVISRWHKACMSPNEFSEIRNAWGDFCGSDQDSNL